MPSIPTLNPDDERKIMNPDHVEQDLMVAGLVGIYDPPRLESAGAIKQC